MRTLDRYIIKQFLLTYVVVLLLMIAMLIVVDLLVNMDEFMEKPLTTSELVLKIISYYACKSLVFFAELGGVVIAIAAIVTFAFMNHTNELTAILASGVSLRRIVWPVAICGTLLGGLIILDRELAIPHFAGQLAMKHGEDHKTDTFQLRLVRDKNKTVIYATNYESATDEMIDAIFAIRTKDGAIIAKIQASTAYASANSDGLPGWASRDAELRSPQLGNKTRYWSQSSLRVYTTINPLDLKSVSQPKQRLDQNLHINNPSKLDLDYNMLVTASKLATTDEKTYEQGGKLISPVFKFIFSPENNHEPTNDIENTENAENIAKNPKKQRIYAEIRAKEAIWKNSTTSSSAGGYWQLVDGEVFCPSDLTPDIIKVRQSSRWMDSLSSSQLKDLLTDSSTFDPSVPMLTRKLRFTEPINNLILMLLPLPFILSRERNIKVAMGFCFLICLVFFSTIFLVRYLRFDELITWVEYGDPISAGTSIAACLPAIIFGPIAVVMLDSIKT